MCFCWCYRCKKELRNLPLHDHREQYCRECFNSKWNEEGPYTLEEAIKVMYGGKPTVIYLNK